jgi:hypothetical protein
MKLSSCVVAFRTKIEWLQLLCSGMRDLPLLAMAVPSETRQKLSGTDRGRKASSARSRCDIRRWREPCAVGDMTRPSGRNLCGVVLLSGCLASFAQPALAQGIDSSAPEMFRRPSESHSSEELKRSRNPYQLNDVGDPNNLNRHLSSTGKPCIALKSYATAELINKNIYEHWIKASNSCGQNIKVQVCYRKTDDCIVMNLPPWETKNAVLGIYPNMKEFEYDAKEK